MPTSFSGLAPLPARARPLSLITCAVLLATPGAAALAQVRPDAGSLLEGIRELNQPAPQAPRTDLIPQSLPAAAASSTATIGVQQVIFEGAQRVPEVELQALAAPLVGATVSLEQINAVAARITALYAQRGDFLSRALVPPQDTRGGILRIRIVEAVYGTADATLAEGARLDPQRVRALLAAQGVAPGAPVQRAGLERSLLLLEDLPGVQTRASFAPGQAVGSSDLGLEVREGALLSGRVGLDNLGGRYTGRGRLSGSVNANDLSGRGDQLRVGGITSSGLDFVSAGYQMPVGLDGLRLGVNASGLDYRLCCAYAPLNARGQVRTLGANASYPLLLSQKSTLRGDWNVERRRSSDDASGTEISRRRIDVSTLSLSWLSSDRLGGLFTLYGGATYGNLVLSGNAANQVFDSGTARTAGHYAKLRTAYARMQSWGPAQLLVRINGQLASKNLDSSEKLSLGGLDGVRAYAQGEAAGDQALLASLEYAHALPLPVPGRVQASAFVDAGRTQLNKNTWNGFQGTRPGLPNQYSLFGWGLGLRWDAAGGASAQLMLATKAGSNAGAQANGQDIDGNTGKTRLLLVFGLPL